MKKFTLLVLVLLGFNFCFSQDVFFANTQQSLVYLNPSFSGSNGFIRNQTVYKNQWPNISGPTYVTFGNSFDAYIKSIKGGLSASVYSDDQGNGTLKMTTFIVAYAQYFSLFQNKLKLVPSIQISYLQETLDKTKLNFGDPVNARYNITWNGYGSRGVVIPSSNQKNINLSSGLLAYYNGFIFGVSAFNINQPDIGLTGLSKLPIRTCINISYNNIVNPRTSMNLSAFTNFQSNSYHSQFNANFIYKNILVLGVGYFSEKLLYPYSDYYYNNNLIGNIGLHFKFLNIAYTYDVGIPKFSVNASSHQLSLSLNLKNKKGAEQKLGIEYW